MDNPKTKQKDICTVCANDLTASKEQESLENNTSYEEDNDAISNILNNCGCTNNFYEKELIEFYLTSSTFRSIVDSGKYVYVDGKIILKSKECLTIEDGKLCINSVLGDELSGYCVHLSYSYRHVMQSNDFEIRKKRNRSKDKEVIIVGGYPGTGKSSKVSVSFLHSKYEKKFEEARKIASVNDITEENLSVIIGEDETPPNDFSQALVYFMNNRGTTIEQLAGLTGLSEKTIQRMRVNANERFSIKAVIAVCIALHLYPHQSERMLELAGYALKTSKTDRLYHFFMNFAYKETVYDCNNALKRCGFSPLTNLHE